MTLVEVMHIYGLSNYGFGSLMMNLVMMVAFYLVMMMMDQPNAIRRWSMQVRSTTMLSRVAKSTEAELSLSDVE